MYAIQGAPPPNSVDDMPGVDILVVLALVSLLAGTLIGTIGIGGILLIPALAFFAQLTTRVAMATALFSFIFTGLFGTYLYQSRRSIDWRITIPVCSGAFGFSYFGALVNSMANTSALNLIFSAIIIFAGAFTLRPFRGHGGFVFESKNAMHVLMLLLVGATVGFMSGLTGTGGPVLSVPMMIIIGFPPLTAIATSQVIQIAAAVSGTIGNVANGAVDFGIASWVTVLELAGVMVGVRIAHSAKTHQLRRLVAILCLLIGFVLFFRDSGLMERI